MDTRNGAPRKVLGVIGNQVTGVTYVRFFQPFRHLRESGFTLATLGENLTVERAGGGYVPGPALLDGIDLLMFPQMVASPVMPDGLRVDLVRPLCLYARERGVPIVYSVDDYLHGIDESNPGFEQVTGSIENLRTILDHADAIFVTTPVLRDSLASTGKPVFVLPNAVDPGDWPARPESPGEPRVGWTGSSSHIEDLRMLVPAIRRAQARLPFDVTLQGLVDVPIKEQLRQIRRLRPQLAASQRVTADAFVELADELRQIRYSHLPFTGTESFLETLPSLDLDLGLCPLLDTEFNRHKSANKFYEYAVTGTTTLASDVTPYAEEASFTVPNGSEEWCDAIEALLTDESLRADHLARQREFVLSHRNIRTLKNHWKEALESVLASRQMRSIV